MPTIKRFEDIEAWQTARQLTRLVYQLSSTGAFARDFGLRDQMRRAAVSVMSNIAEGFESRTQALFIEFLGRARASAGDYSGRLPFQRPFCHMCLKHYLKRDDQCLKLVHGEMVKASTSAGFVATSVYVNRPI
jgi:hypothetical protein